MRSLPISARLGVALAIVTLAPIASADDVQDAAKADALFSEAVALIDHDLEAGCAKFEESLRYNKEAIGTLLNVARCDEKRGRIASAVGRYRDVRARAREHDSKEYLAAAEAQLALLEPTVPHIVISFAGRSLADTKVVIDDKLIPLSALDHIEVDPGDRTIVVTAPGRVAFETKVAMSRGDTKHVEVPELAPAVVTSSRRRIGQLATIGGGAMLVTGGIVMLVARSKYNAQFTPDSNGLVHCDTDKTCDSVGASETRRARTFGAVATALGGIGLVVTGVGAYLWLRSPHEHASSLAIVPLLDRDGAGVAAIGQF